MIQTLSHRSFLKEVNPVESNQRMKLFDPSFNPSMDDDATIIFLSSRETKKDFEDLPITFISSVSIDLPSFKWASFFGTSARLLSFLADLFCSSFT